MKNKQQFIPKANVVKSFVVDTVGFISVLHKLMNRQGCIVGLYDSVRHFRTGDHRVGVHNSVGEFFADFRDEKCSHSRSGSTSKGVGKLESLETITGLCFFTNNIKDGVDELSS